MNRAKKQRFKLGDIFEIKLPNGKNAYGRLYKEYMLAIYNQICEDISELQEGNNYRFFVGVYKDILQDGVWPIVANREFESDNDA